MANPLEELIARHGNIIGYVPVDPTIQKKVGSTTVTVPNPSPSYKYIFSNGAWAALRPPNPDNPTDVSTGQFIVTDPGTAYKATANPSPGEAAKDTYEAELFEQKTKELREPAPKSLQPRYKPGTEQSTYVPGVGSVEVPGTGEIYDYYDPATGKTVELNKPDVRQVGNSILERDAEGNWVVRYTAPREPREPTGQLTEYQRFQIGNYGPEQEESRRRFDVQEMRAQQDREAQRLSNELTNRRGLFDTMSQARERNLQWQVPEGQQYMPMLEPGGLAANILGSKFKPMPVVRVPWDNISGEEIWKRTRGMTGG